MEYPPIKVTEKAEMTSSLRDGPEFVPESSDALAYDHAGHIFLISESMAVVELAIKKIESRQFLFDTMVILHRDALDVELLYRQSMPAAGISRRMRIETQDAAAYIELFALAQTLILNHIDRHLDLSSSYSIRDPQKLLGDARSTMCYAVASLYAAMRDVSEDKNAARALGEMATVSFDIIQSMYDNYATRFGEEDLVHPERLLRTYRVSPQSRHLGSGFYGSSIAGLYAYFGMPPSPLLPTILRDMRRLRQRVDELSDIFEDTVTGLLNYPVLLLLSSEARTDAVRVIRLMWEQSRRLISTGGGDAGLINARLVNDERLRNFSAELHILLQHSGIFDIAYDEADQLWRSTRRMITEALDKPVAEILCVVVDLKRALLSRIRNTGWINIAPPYTFGELRAEILKTTAN